MPSDEANLHRQLREKVATSPLSEVLPQLLMLAKDLQHEELERWVQLELRGYLATNPAMTEEIVVPEYRGVTGLWHNDMGQPLMIRDAELSRTINSYRLRNGVAELEEISKANKILSALDQSFPPLIQQHLKVDVSHFQFYSREVAGVLAEIRSRAIEWLSDVKSLVPKEAPSFEAPNVTEVATLSATVFYSWQSDLPNSTNRGFIEDCLERVIKEIKADGQIRVEPCLDRDTLNVPGSPDISATIFDKIESAALFICDVSIINNGTEGRLTPNPNVLIELGYAVKTLGWNRVVCVFNSITGEVEDLPFDLRQRRVRTYSLEEKQEKSEPRKWLMRSLKADLQAAFAFTGPATPTTEASAESTSASAPRIEVLDATVECQPPIVQPGKKHVHHIRPQYEEGRLVWTATATCFVDSHPGEAFTVALHRCKAWMDDRYSGQRIPMTNLTFQSEARSQVSVDDAVLLIRGPGRFSIQGSCETPFRQSGYPDVVKIDIEMPVAELANEPIRIALAPFEAHQGGGWPLRWKHRDATNHQIV
jgi:hypothetical protein